MFQCFGQEPSQGIVWQVWLWPRRHGSVDDCVEESVQVCSYQWLLLWLFLLWHRYPGRWSVVSCWHVCLCVRLLLPHAGQCPMFRQPFDIPDTLHQAIEQAESFLQAFHLPVAVSKCWSWAVQAPDRRTLRSFTFFGGTLLVKLSARDLGADISYCRRRAAKVRNARVVNGHQRLLKLSGLPCPVWRKTRLLLSSVFPHTLHAAETTLVPKTTFQRLRTKVSKGLGLAKKGSSPYLSCLLGTYRCVDPEFVVVLNRVQSFRQVVRELPDLHSFFFRHLNSNASRKGPTALLVQSLNNWGWHSENPGVFQDEFGHMFHLLLTPSRMCCNSSCPPGVMLLPLRSNIESILKLSRTLTAFFPNRSNTYSRLKGLCYVRNRLAPFIPGSIPGTSKVRMNSLVVSVGPRTVDCTAFGIVPMCNPGKQHFRSCFRRGVTLTGIPLVLDFGRSPGYCAHGKVSKTLCLSLLSPG